MSLIKNLAVALVTAALISSAAAQSMKGMNHSAHEKGPMADYMATMDTMMKAMADTKSTGDADADFLLMMIPHHQSAIDMAQIELQQGKDAQTRKIAKTIIDAQIQEIADMKAMLKRLGVTAAD
jgi:uncharacterized protein (DUF305 family)